MYREHVPRLPEKCRDFTAPVAKDHIGRLYIQILIKLFNTLGEGVTQSCMPTVPSVKKFKTAGDFKRLNMPFET